MAAVLLLSSYLACSSAAVTVPLCTLAAICALMAFIAGLAYWVGDCWNACTPTWFLVLTGSIALLGAICAGGVNLVTTEGGKLLLKTLKDLRKVL